LKVIVRIKGGLGNQLFCYAAARRLALVNNAELVIDDVTGFVRDSQYQRKYALGRFLVSARKATPEERMEPFERYRRGLAKFIARQRPFHLRSYVEQEGLDFDLRLLDYRLKRGTVYLDGLWQSENYFKDVEEIIRQDLRIIYPEDEVNRRMAERILACNAVVVHVRFFDKSYGSNSPHNLEGNYYIQAIREISKRVENPHFFLFSDNSGEARQKMGLSRDKITCIDYNPGEENAYADLWLMTQCKYFIIANSTFSWWGAWLANFKSKIVIAPDIKISGLSAWGFDGFIPDDWMLL
jgi:hypothetical protein